MHRYVRTAFLFFRPGLIIEPGELQLESDLDNQHLIDASLLDQTALSDLGSAQQLSSESPNYPLHPLQKRFCKSFSPSVLRQIVMLSC